MEKEDKEKEERKEKWGKGGEERGGERESEGSVERRTGGRAGTRRRTGFHSFISLQH